MNVSQFVAKWRRSTLNERAASQEHFIDLCRVFDHPTPAEADGSGITFTFEKEIAKANGRMGRADVWKRDFFAWEYKSKGKSLTDAHDQLSQYRESLLNPPLLAACDMGVLDIRTNFTRRETRRYEVLLEDLGSSENRRIIENLFYYPDKLEPGRDVEAITDKAAGKLADIAKKMRARGLDPKQVALFLDRVVFCLFAQDVRLLDDRVFSRIVEKSHGDPRRISKAIFELFRTMNEGGNFGSDHIPHFNGDLFANVHPFELEGNEIDALHRVSHLNWAEVDASIIGTLFERGMDPTKEAGVGAHYTSREDISAIVDPVVISPLRAEWKRVRDKVDDLLEGPGKSKARGMGSKSPSKQPARKKEAGRRIIDFLHDLRDLRILDPACGSGNFLYVTLQKLKDLEKEVLVYASQRNIGQYLPGVGPWQLRGIEKNPYAYDLARMTIWIGWLQWTKDNGYKVDWEPILGSLSDNLRNSDAILDLSNPNEPREPVWPEAEFIVGNPPFLGTKKLRRELGDAYVDSLFRLYGNRIPNFSDLCCYWFEKARAQIESGKTNRAGLIATQGIRGRLGREVLHRISQSGGIFFADSDRDWVQDGANVHVSLIGFDNGSEAKRTLDGMSVTSINSNLTSTCDVTLARPLIENAGIGFIGDVKSGKFDLPLSEAQSILTGPNPNGRPNSDVLVPWAIGIDVVRRNRDYWIIDFGTESTKLDASFYELPFEKVARLVKPERAKVKRKRYRDLWWLHAEPCGVMRREIGKSHRYLVTPAVSKHRIFAWMPREVLPDHQLIAFARSDDYFFGILHSRVHEVWSRSQGTQVRERESGFRYTPTTCFETFPFPQPFAGLQSVIEEAGKKLDVARNRWLNPPEWTREEVLAFPGSASGPWAHLVADPDEGGIGSVRYSRRVPKDGDRAAKLAKRTLTNLYNERPMWLELAHRELDEAVFAAYGWSPDLSHEELLTKLLALNQDQASSASDPKAGTQHKKQELNNINNSVSEDIHV